ncbi:serine protease do, putative [Heliomicrobium modesticaldum Ice1]|uniref:Serine protease do, putative n=1 Tax=Heliobacterium modesticaldum (strain ATCC 51547 / Ice1) TaxID=498761 RepID=B0TA41_HELMI|nr:trypsin-like peptidase domain-containing protein [Heliomicrobium modesticaldum]ABZ83578.1 serine protease do, putative [Heliomicrobium modesticaldum Ice1]
MSYFEEKGPYRESSASPYNHRGNSSNHYSQGPYGGGYPSGPFGKPPKGRPGLLSYFVVALAAAVLGGYISQYFAPHAPAPGPSTPPPSGYALPPQVADPAQVSLDGNRVVQVARAVGPAVVGISNRVRVSQFFRGNRIEEQGTGSGVIFDGAGFIVTNHHVVAGAAELVVTLTDGRTAPATLVGSDPKTDLAVIKINLDNLPVAKFGDSSKLSVGELAIAIGNPGGKEFAGSVTQGIVSGLNRQLNTPEGYAFNLIQTDAAINPGNSGGALLNANGEVIGINSIKIAVQGFEGMGFAIPSNQVMQIVNELRAKGKVSRAALGVTLIMDVDKELAQKYNLIVDYGVVVKPSPGGPAQKAGMQNNDILIAINDKPVRNRMELQKELFAYKVGDTVNVTVVREDQKQTLSVTLGELPPQ